MATLGCQFHCRMHHISQNVKAKRFISCSTNPPQSNIKVIINGAVKEIGRAAVIAVTKARGMEVAGAIDSHSVGEDIGMVCDMEQPLEIPVMSDLTMVLGSISQSKARAVVIDFTDASTVYDNVKQATAFGMRSVVYVPHIQLETVSALSAFCDKASMGCLIAPTLSIGSILLQQAAISASFHYKNVEIVESRPNARVRYMTRTLISMQVCLRHIYLYPKFQNNNSFHTKRKLKIASSIIGVDATQIANNLSNLGQIYNREDISTDVKARGQVLGEDGVRVHSMVLPGLPSSTTVYFSRPGEVYSIKHDITDVQSLMPGLILAIRKVVHLKNLVYGLEKFL
ncbi:Dihydrodipicolinate reductase-like protein CRR1 [Citrus sinensis]|uniref:Dihydrodipicolinate reductase-like protein CRR1 n=1 Tax=Citrus sinensis TaxID=2711 RepID=A0ACB8HT46_CITSI|nr:Dihydrodipicolinate reductase-like protein CRR1 [Citrus sinensis]KAH9677990.1 Dihydrodipicolinate reductase-like protein CRR1 [Citrus sinensis]